MRVAVEVCVTSVEEAAMADALGVDSVEVCSWLGCGGITPSSGLVDAIRNAIGIPARVLVRPTPGGFIYSKAESAVLLTDAEVFGGGALGLVTGALDGNHDLHVPIMSAVQRLAPESEITFHRAIDRSRDPLRVMDLCLELGIDRILASGGSTLAIDGAGTLRALVDRASGACLIAAAGGVNAANVVELVERTGVPEVHFSAQRSVLGRQEDVSLSSSYDAVGSLTEPDPSKVEEVLNALVKAGLR
ncbi:MAG: copper homeostasis protein CutC [Flavobacteriales bacterium]|nr:copper homeostasis protein CutC [Flavobacteriales bacterium]